MAMVTRCPNCAALFRVSAAQLQARQGRVRCGRCATIFDGFRDLATLPEKAPADGGRPEIAERTAASLQPQTSTAGAYSDSVTSRSPETPAVPAGFRFEPIAAPASDASARGSGVAARAEMRTDHGLSATPPIGADARFLEQAQAARRRGLRGWALGSMLLAVGLTAQATYFYRGDLAAHYRPLRPLLLAMCEALECEVPLPQRPKLINIEASDVQNVDPARPGVIELTATLRNHADYVVAYPALDLVLTNTRDHTLARRVFLPREYLDPARDAKAGFPAKAEITIRLALDTGELGAAGFRLDLLPAPQ